MNKSSFEQNGGSYRMVGDYRVPDITLSSEANKPLGVWGLKRKDYLMQHKRVQFNILLMNGTLWNHLAEVDEQASDMFSRLVEQMKLNEEITEQLKADSQIEWVACMNNIEARAREIVKEKLSDFIGSDFAHLTNTEDENTIQAEYICSTAGKED